MEDGLAVFVGAVDVGPLIDESLHEVQVEHLVGGHRLAQLGKVLYEGPVAGRRAMLVARRLHVALVDVV